jgi:hypothetical protein
VVVDKDFRSLDRRSHGDAVEGDGRVRRVTCRTGAEAGSAGTASGV